MNLWIIFGGVFTSLMSYLWPLFSFIHTNTHPFNGPFSRTTRVGQYQKGKTNLDFTEARDSEWQWHQLGHMQVYILLQTDNHASTSPLSYFTGRMPFLPPNQQRQSTEGNHLPLFVSHNSVQCTSCQKWVQKKCSCIKGSMFKVMEVIYL